MRALERGHGGVGLPRAVAVQGATLDGDRDEDEIIFIFMESQIRILETSGMNDMGGPIEDLIGTSFVVKWLGFEASFCK